MSWSCLAFNWQLSAHFVVQRSLRNWHHTVSLIWNKIVTENAVNRASSKVYGFFPHIFSSGRKIYKWWSHWCFLHCLVFPMPRDSGQHIAFALFINIHTDTLYAHRQLTAWQFSTVLLLQHNTGKYYLGRHFNDSHEDHLVTGLESWGDQGRRQSWKEWMWEHVG